MPDVSSTWLAVLSGACGACAAISGRCSGSLGFSEEKPWDHILARAAFYLALLMFNAGGMACYVRSLQGASSISVTSLSLMANTTISGVAGHCLFSEQLSLRWLAGAVCIILGVLCIQCSSAPGPSTQLLTPTPPPPTSQQQQVQQQEQGAVHPHLKET
mmetsp:Transcript_7950/g.21220  ORF Transcript_7950/g.21220 Transcript_7950/m.21220 type:complete len:159 (+) Transcript_7950:149-625(+)